VLIEFLEAFSPPGQLDRTERRLGRAGHDVGQSVLDCEQRVECRPQLDGPIEPDEVALADFSDR
jgi:hypothetical protein